MVRSISAGTHLDSIPKKLSLAPFENNFLDYQMLRRAYHSL